jgi:hypothetical protein
MTEQQIRELSPAERNTLAELALGRILRMGARKSEPGDGEQFDKCRNLFVLVSQINKEQRA